MNILATQYTLKTKSFEIYIAGCKGKNGVHCRGCHNPLSWDFEQGRPVTADYIQEIRNKVKDFSSIIDNIWILGGEPLDNDPKELTNLIKELQVLNKPIWLFTRFSLQEVGAKISLNLFDYIKCGEYIPALKIEDDMPKNIQYGVELATSNQHIYKKGVDY